jgi:carboxymethylenebutenolidase
VVPVDHVTVVPSATPKGGVVLLQEAFGVTPYLLDVARRLAAAGWSATVPHLYHRSGSPAFAYDVNHGDGVDCREPSAEQAAAAAIGPHAMQLTRTGVIADVDDAIAELGALGISPANAGVLGFCFGGSVALYTSAARRLGAAVAYYGAGIAAPHFSVPAFTEVAATRATPLLGCYGALDRWITAADIDTLERQIARSPVPGQVNRYAGAGHGFHCDLRSTYHQASARAAWAQTLAWLDHYAAGISRRDRRDRRDR